MSSRSRLAPLRERKSDIPPLAAHFLERACKEFNKPLGLMSGEALAALKAYDWPGNVRELQNVVERAVITARDGPIFFELPSVPDATPASRTRQRFCSRSGTHGGGTA